MRRLIIGALALTGVGALALFAYAVMVEWSLRILGNPEGDPFTEPYGDC